MPHLTQADISPEAIEELEKQLAAQTSKVERLRQEQCRLLRELEECEKERSCTLNALRWRRLMADAECDENVTTMSQAIESAVADFRKTLLPPEDYDESAEGICFSDTDDYADLSFVESLIDESLETIQRLVSANAAPLKEDEESQKCRRTALLMLLVLTLKIARVADLPTEDVFKEMEELQENIAVAWHSMLLENSGLSEEERTEWIGIADTFLGPPYAVPA